tara:strand:- start:3590 stop:3775 length:186 start_codon:yes stop_codon:yes gene_type:complete
MMEVNRAQLITDDNAVCRHCKGNGFTADLNHFTGQREFEDCFFCDSSGKETVLVFNKKETK